MIALTDSTWISGAWIAGAILIGLLTLLLLLQITETTRRLSHQRAKHFRELELLDLNAAARAIRQEREQAAMSWNGFRKFEVQRKVQEGGGICSFYLAPHDRKSLPGFRPGQYLTFSLDIPGQTSSVIRCYSLSDGTGKDCYRVSIKRVPPPRDKPDLSPGLSSSYFHDHVQEGDILDVKAASGHFFLDTSRETPVVLIGGGVGITPVLSMLNTIVESGSRRETWFFYGVRQSDEHLMADHLRRIAEDHDNVHLNVCYSEPRDEDTLDHDFQHKGYVSVDLLRSLLPSNNYDFYTCGPPPMMESITSGLKTWGVPNDRIHYEAFGPATIKRAKPKAAAEADHNLEVTFSRSGQKLTWDGSHDSILEFAEANGIVMDSGCRAGNCGTCLTAIKSGDVDYCTEPGADAEEGSCLTCVCVPKGPLVLDA